MSRITVARALSIAGHPAVLVPCAVVVSAAAQGAGRGTILAALLAVASVAAGVVLYSRAQVKSGRWTHMDASDPSERRQLNPRLALLLCATAAVLLAAGQDIRIAAGLALGGAMVAAAHLLRSWLKASLHAAFAVYCAFLVWPGVAAAFAIMLLAAGVAWSRLVLERHTRAEVVAGALLGMGAGIAFRFFLGVVAMGAAGVGL